MSVDLTIVARADSTGGTIGKIEKSASGGESTDADQPKVQHSNPPIRSSHESVRRVLPEPVRRVSHETARPSARVNGASVCAHVRYGVRAATAAGLDNGVGLIAAARAVRRL